MEEENKYISDLIGQDFKDWPDDAKVEIIAGTGRGKTYFALNIYIDYCFRQHKNILYLCNRVALYDQVRPRVDYLPGVTVTTYQSFQSKIKKHTAGTYDVIIADEFSFVVDDASFNFDTVVSYNWITSQTDSQIIFMDANGGILFDMVRNVFNIQENMIYVMPKSYDYVDSVYFYEPGELTQLVDNILTRPTDEKALVFVKSMKRLRQLHDIYGDKAEYYAGVQQKDRWLNKKCIKDEKFSKKILFTTTALGCGVDIKDESLKTIICELYDIHGVIQSIGRKRPINENDTCNFYFCNFWKNSITQEYCRMQTQIADAEFFLRDKEAFRDSFLYSQKYIKEDGTEAIKPPRNYYQAIRDNPIFCPDPNDPEIMIVNPMTLQKLKCDVENERIWKEWCGDFKGYLLSMLGDELAAKTKDLIMDEVAEETFSVYLDANYKAQTRYFRKVNLQELKDAFYAIGLHDKRMGIGVLNGKLEDLGSIYRIESKPQDCSTEPYFRKKYWHLIKLDEVQEGA